MRRRILAGGALAFLLGSGLASAGPAALVNPLIGTANGGDVFPGAALPFGMVQFTPEESPDLSRKRPLIAGPGGYEYKLDRIRGFGLTNVSGWGCAGGAGDVPLMPVTTAVTSSPSNDFRWDYSITFNHANERAEAGRYRVRLDNGVGVDLTTTLRTGAARFSFPAGKPAIVLIRTSDSEVGSEDAHVRIDPDRRTVSGEVRSGNFCGYLDPEDRKSYYTLHFVAMFDQPFSEHGVWRDGVVTHDGLTSSGGTGYGPTGFPPKGKGSGAWVGFDTFKTGDVVSVRIGVSYVSEANARANLAAEAPTGGTFDAEAAQAQAQWDRRLGQIAISGGTADQQTVFYTALYHANLTPNLLSDVDGRYPGMDGRIHRLEPGQRAQYANFSGWDVYRSQFQLLAWLDPQLGSDIATSLFSQAKANGGAWDRWTHETGATHVMNGDPAAPAIADLWAFGARSFDAQGALASLVRAADQPTAADISKKGCPVVCAGERPGLDQWLKLQFIPTGAPQWGGAADTLEDATADFSLSALAARLGQHATAERFLQRAQYWRNVFNPSAAPDGGYMQNRNPDGSWALVKDDDDSSPKPFSPSTEDGFVEGSAAQYVWMVPFNPRGLFDAMGGVQRARTRLDGLFYRRDGSMAVTNAGPLHSELNNEPSIGVPWLYDYAGAPWKTQQLIRQVLNTLWVNQPDGLPGNDDLGAMSSWAVWAMLGLYPETPGRAELVLGSPLFAAEVVHRPGGDVRITAAEANGPYVQTLKVNGAITDQAWLPEAFALRGGELDFRLGAAPNRRWGVDLTKAPPSFDSR